MKQHRRSRRNGSGTRQLAPEMIYILAPEEYQRAVVNIFLNYIFVKLFGFVAAGYTTVVCYLIFSMCHYVFMRRVSRKYMGGKRVYDMKKLTAMVAGFLTGSICVSFLYYHSFAVVRYTLISVLVIAAIVERKKVREMILRA